ncbi:MAG: sulfotransferase [Candidatus Caenarcaniphilales bacterium]|nr:sulfotransferase [Candidatus Caenarcaniphilales bacterium]
MQIEEVYKEINLNLFIISPNNSGSTFLSKAISCCSQVAHLPIEGQHLPCWAGPSIPAAGLNLIWGAEKFNYVRTLQNPQNYNWSQIKKCWYSNIRSKSNNFSLFLEKSPPHLTRVEMLENNFHNSRFVFLMRNPFAIAESIVRYRSKVENILEIAASHIVTCFYLQKENYKKYPDSLKINYEEMCDNPIATEQKIISYFPELYDLKLDQQLKVKSYNERLRNMNQEQIARLSNQQLKKLSLIFSQHKPLFNFFGYETFLD